MCPPMERAKTEETLSSPEATVARFYNALFGHTRNWPRAFSCLAPGGCAKFDSTRGLMSFADYWDDTLSFLEEFVEKRHSEFSYTHRTCFSLDTIHIKELSGDSALVSVEILENHLAPERLAIVQTKKLIKHGQRWLLENGELEGNLDTIIGIRRRPRRSNAKSTSD